jgi:hypothetical protein
MKWQANINALKIANPRPVTYPEGWENKDEEQRQNAADNHP